MRPHDRAVFRILSRWCRVEPLEASDAAHLDLRGWDALVRIARREGVGGLVYRALVSGPSREDAPPPVAAALKAQASEQAAAHAWEGPVLAEAIDAFDARGITHVLLRGHGLVETIYEGDGSLRPQVDHDLLVPEDQVAEARQALFHLGFERRHEGLDLFVRGRSTIDLHVDPYDRGRVPCRGRVIKADGSGVIRRAVAGRVAGREIRQPAPGDRLLLLSAHVVKHSFDRLIRLVDLAECWRQLSVDGEALLLQAREEGTSDALYYALAAARARLGAGVGELTLGRARPQRPRPHLDRLFARVLEGRPSPFFAEWLLMHQLEGLRPRMTALWELLVPPEEKARSRSRAPLHRLGAWSARLARLSRGAITSAAQSMLSRPGPGGSGRQAL